MRPTITIIIPAFNEEGHLGITVQETIKTIEPLVDDYEILIIDDGSSDQTGPMADEFSRQNPKIRAVHNEQNRGLGFSCARGIQLATKDYIGWVPADTVWEPGALKEVIGLLGSADIVTTYLLSLKERTWFRRFISRSFTVCLNVLFRLNLKYYNGGCFHRRELLQSLSLKSKGFTIWAEALVRLSVQGYRCREVGAYFKERTVGQSTALSWRSVKQTLSVIGILIRDIYFRKETRRPKGEQDG